jgi:hypothetical protein
MEIKDMLPFPALETKGDAPEQYTYPLDGKTLGTYMNDKKEVATYFKNVFANDIVYRACNGLNKWQIQQLNDLEIEMMCVICAEAASRIFPTRQVYDAAVAPCYKVLKEGGTLPGETAALQPEQWKTDDLTVLYEQMKAAMLDLQTKFKGGVKITDGSLYPEAAKALLYGRCIYHRLLTSLIENDPSLLVANNPQGAQAPAAAPAATPAAQPAGDAAAKSALTDDLTTLEVEKKLAEFAKRLTEMSKEAEKIDADKFDKK